MKISAFAAKGPNQKLEAFSYEMGALGPEQVVDKSSAARNSHTKKQKP